MANEFFTASTPDLRAFAKHLGEANAELRPKLNEGLRQAADIVATASRAVAPVRTGNLRKSIKAYGGNATASVRVNATRTTKNYGARGGDRTVHTKHSKVFRGGRYAGHRISRRMGYENPYRYPRIIEFGGGRIKAQPFLYNTADALRPVVLDKIEQLVTDLYARAWKP